MTIIEWIIIWYGAFAGYHLFFKKRGLLYKNNPALIVIWYFVVSVVSIALFYPYLQNIVVTVTTWSVTIGALLVIGALFLWYRGLTLRSYVPLNDSRNVFISKTVEIIFQQLMVWSLFYILGDISFGLHPLLIFSLVFFVIHIPLMMVIPWKKGLLFTLASLVGGVVFAACMSFLPAGWLVSLSLHIIFYAAIASKRKLFGMDVFYVL